MASPALRHILTGMDRDAGLWRDAIYAAGSSVSTPTLRAVNRLVIGLKAASLWNKCYAIDPCCGADLTAALIRLKTPAGVARSMTNVNFVAGDYTEATGLTGDGSTKYLDTLINPTSIGMSLTAAGLWCYTRSTAAAGGTSEISIGHTPTGNNFVLGWINTGSKESAAIFSANLAAGAPEGSASALTGFLGGATQGGRTQRFYQNGVVVGATADSAGGLGNTTLFKHANRSNAGTPANFTDRPLSTSIITADINTSEALRLATLVIAFETALGRNV